MTDVPGLLVILLCLYLCLRALASEDDRTALLWLALASATNVAGGTVRQIAWLGSLVMVPSTAWLMRRRRYALPAGALLWTLSLAGVLACLHWWDRQPYSVPEKIIQGPISAAMVAHLGAELLKAVLCTALLLLPLLAAWLPRYTTLPRNARLFIPALIAALAAAAYVLHRQHNLHFWTMPWLIHVLGSEGIFQFNWDMPGWRPVTVPVWLQAVISISVIGTAAIFLCAVPYRLASASLPYEGRWLLLPYTLAYVCLLIPRGLYSFLYDRYLLGVLPVLLICILAVTQIAQVRVSLLSYTVLAAFAAYGVLATHDLFALNRARIAAVHEVLASGISPNLVQAGFEYDGWTEIALVGHFNDKRIQNPYSAYIDDARYLARPQECRLGFDEYTPALNRRYLVVLPNVSCGVQSAFRPVPYRGWLPPFDRWVYIREVPQLPAR